MIGVLCAPSEREAVAEFFELFKTPWAFYDAGTRFSALFVTDETRIIQLDAPAVVAFGAKRSWVDDGLGLALGDQRTAGTLVSEHVTLPLAGTLVPLLAEEGVVARLAEGGEPVVAEVEHDRTRVLRCGYDLFGEISTLIGPGQASHVSTIPTLDLHIDLLRRWLVAATGLLVEVPPVRGGHPFAVCLTHDVDFLAIRSHRFDSTLVGFLMRASIGSVRDVVSRHGSFRRLARNWLAILSLPLVHMRLLPDLWAPFSSYLRVDGGRSTFFVIPFRARGGSNLDPKHARRRAVNYDVSDLASTLRQLCNEGNEVGVHGIDAWHSEAAGRAELERVADVVGERVVGIRMHWLCQDEETSRVLERAGFAYDASGGYNEALGFKAGTTQVFRAAGADRLLSLPLHIQDTALFFPDRLHLRESEAWRATELIRGAAGRLGGVLTVSWHDRSLAPERLWDRFYSRLLVALRTDGAWFGTAREVVDWFRLRRSLTFGDSDVSDGVLRVGLRCADEGVPTAGLILRVHVATERRIEILDVVWKGERTVEVALPVREPAVFPQ